MEETTIAAEPVPAFEPALVIFGLDDAGKAHASVFGAEDVELAIRAAGFMRMFVLPVDTDECRTLALGLARGKVFASGKAFAPFSKMAAYEALKALGGEVPPLPAGVEPKPAAASKSKTPPTTPYTSVAASRADIVVGALVLAEETKPHLGFFAAAVQEIRGEGICVLRWRDWPTVPAFVRRCDDLGLLPPPVQEVCEMPVAEVEDSA